MNKKYIVRLSDDERGVCQEIVKRLKGTSEKVKRAQILLKADADSGIINRLLMPKIVPNNREATSAILFLYIWRTFFIFPSLPTFY